MASFQFLLRFWEFMAVSSICVLVTENVIENGFLEREGTLNSFLGFLLFCSSSVCSWVVSVFYCVLLLRVSERK